MFRAISCSPNAIENNTLSSYYLIAYTNSNKIPSNSLEFLRCWIVDINVKNRQVYKIEEFPVESIPSYYAHCGGTCACNIDCPDFIEDYITSHVNMDEINKEEVVVYRETIISRPKRKVIKRDE